MEIMDPPPNPHPPRIDSRREPRASHSPSSSQSQSTTRHKAAKPSQIDVPSYSSFQPDQPAPNRTPPVRRKPLPPTASTSPPFPNLSSGGQVVAVGLQPQDKIPPSGRVPVTGRTPWYQPQSGPSPQLVVRDLDQFPRGLSPNIPQSPGFTPFHELSAEQARAVLHDLDIDNYSPSTLSHARNSDPPRSPTTANTRPHHQLQRSVTMPPKKGGPGSIQILPPSNIPNPGPLTPQRTLSTSNKISNFFGWKANIASSPIVETSPTTISDRSSLAGSPNGTSLSSFYSSAKPLPAAIDVPRANAPAAALFSSSSFPQQPPTPTMSMQLEELEEELRDISAELASSIRREMELEEEVERLQLEVPGASEKDKRTSDYYSDSGTSSIRDPETGSRIEEVEKLKRRSEQEKAQMKLDVSQKVQEERGKRKALEEHIRALESHVQSLEQGQGVVGGTGRVQELQNALEDNRRRLVEEKKHKENYEDLIAALRVDLVNNKNERDNLRDEVVPQLRARVEGLESDAAEMQRLTYENARMQQELQAIKSSRSIGSIAEEDGPPPTPKMGLSRSSSLMRGSNSLSRSNSVTKKERESRESLADRVKEIEAQRDALHRALKGLLDRQKYQNREHEKRVQALETERDRALEAHSPRRRGYEKEVTDLRFEINELRKRADDALEQKWQCEKGLGGLKKDLDRAEQETGSLRKLLVENDILVPDLSNLSTDNVTSATHATSATLERAYKELREAQALSVSKLKELKDVAPSSTDDAKTSETMDILLKSMSNAEAERDFAQKQAATYRARAESLQDVSAFQEGENVGLAEQLKASALRVETLSNQVKVQLSSNSGLRERLAEAVGKGEREQKLSAARINSLQGKLKSLEDRLMIAQQQSEDSIMLHEEEVRVIRRSNNNQLQRLRPPLAGTPGTRTPRSPLSPMVRSPKLDKTSSGAGISMTEALRTEYLEQRVKELEAALADAEKEMGEVVQKMNAAQIEVMELQSDRDEAMKQTRTLQNKIVAENENYGSLMGRFLNR